MNNETPTRRHVAASSTKPPMSNGAVNSAFDLASKFPAAPPQATKAGVRYAAAAALDLDKVKIITDRPLPDRNGKVDGRSVYEAILQRMKPGNSVDLPIKAARSLVSRAKKMGIPVALRALDEETAGVWMLHPKVKP